MASWATIVGVPLAVAGLVIALWVTDDDVPIARVELSTLTAPTPRPAALERVDVLVRNGLGPDEGAVLEIVLRNSGGERVVLTRARLEIRRVTPLPLCYTQGDLPLSNRYGTELPVDADPGDVMEVPLHQQLAPDRADRFEIALSAVTGETGAELKGMYLFEIAISLVHDGDRQPLSLGAALVSLPGVPTAVTYFWDRETAADLQQNFNPTGRNPARMLFPDQVMNCWRSNTEGLRSALDTRSARSADLDAISARLATPSYGSLEAALTR